MKPHICTLYCVDCGAEFKSKATNAKRCKTCTGEYLRAQRREYDRKRQEHPRNSYTPRKQTTMICQSCGQETIRNSGNQKYCPTCTTDAIYRRNIEAKKRRAAAARGEIVIPHVGDLIKCADCGKEIIKNTARHIRCAECAEKHRIEHSKELWQKKKAEAKAERRRLAAMPKAKTLSDVVSEARRWGLSYGQYTTLLNTGMLEQYIMTHSASSKGA